jgi:hypothetical protein
MALRSRGNKKENNQKRTVSKPLQTVSN